MKKFSTYLQEIAMPKERFAFSDESGGSMEIGSEKLADLNLEDIMAKYGWYNIGNGYYAMVFAHSSKSYVIKVFSDDQNTRAWLEFVSKNQRNKYLPKLRGKPVRVGKSIYAVRMEKLKPITSTEYKKFMNNVYYANTEKDIQSIKSEIKLIRGEDIHDENIMKRSNGDIVLVDPVGQFNDSSMSTKDLLAYIKDLKSGKI